METSVVSSKSSDGSKDWAVLFIDGSTAVRIECPSESSAYSVQRTLELEANYVVIDPHYREAA
jgi:hypothetical protein